MVSHTSLASLSNAHPYSAPVVQGLMGEDRSTSLCPRSLTLMTSERGLGLNYSSRHRWHFLAFSSRDPRNYRIQGDGKSGCGWLCYACPSRHMGWTGREPSPSEEREVPGPQSCAHPPLRALPAPTPHPALVPAPPSSACTPRYLVTQVRCLAGRSYRGAGASAGLPPRPFLQESLSLPRCHRSLADGPQELSKEAPGPPSARNLLLLGRSWAGGERAAVGWAGPGPSAPVLATGLSGPQGLLSCLDVQKDPGRKCHLRT